MWRYPDGTFKQRYPTTVTFGSSSGVRFFDLTRSQQDEIGYNEAIPLAREPFSTYETQWVKGSDLIYREEEVSCVVDQEAKDAAKESDVRRERDALLAGCDWTHLGDTPLTTEQRTQWTAYRQDLRDITGQSGFPYDVTWPTPPADIDSYFQVKEME